ncbi:MAG: glycosyltransferase [Nitrospina sp.]|nr:glycosyltransferase [Nitrospina sp.]
MNFKILTFNWHEPYLCMLARIGYEFLVVEPEISSDQYRRWDENMRPVPTNVELISMSTAREILDRGEFDLIIAHNIKDLIAVRDYSVPKIMVFHNCLTTEIKLGQDRISRSDYIEKIDILMKGVQKVFISGKKKSDWGLKGAVIPPGLDINDYGGYHGTKDVVLQVGNLLLERDLMMGYSTSQQIVGDHPLVTLGLNPKILGSRLSRGFTDLLENFRQSRVFINTTVDEFEDGYNLSMLEAMATGMPVVSSWNKTSPINNAENGYISNDLQYLNNRLEYLLKNQDEAMKLGEKARKTVQEKFPLHKFLASWGKVIEKSVVDFLESTGINLQNKNIPFENKVRKNILMDFVSYPATTAHYLERAFKLKHNVITCGAQINADIIKLWNLEALNHDITPQDIYRDNATPLQDILKQLPDGWEPDFYMWVETGLSDIPSDLHSHKIPKICYLIDTHIHLDRHIEIAKSFDFIFLAQKIYVQPMKNAGIKNVSWLPLACDPEIHGKIQADKSIDVGFVGTISSTKDRRRELLERLQKQFHLDCQRKFMEEMAEHYSKSRIVFNNAVNNDLNMRVFEALCSGSLLLTDFAPGSGLDELFQDKIHLVNYNDDELEDRVAEYLDNAAERERIATAGRKEVLQKHTYVHRADEIIRILNDELGNEKDANLIDKKPDSYYGNIRKDLIPLVPIDAKCILEVGCAAGLTGQELKRRNGAFVAGVELDCNAALEAESILDDVINGDIEKIEIPYRDETFDCILFADVLEHLVDPLNVLVRVKRLLKDNGTVVACIPNVQFHGVIHQLIEGNWTYEKEGILDATHLRFFTLKEIEKMFKQAGYFIKGVEEVLDPQYDKLSSSSMTALNFGRTQINDLTPDEIKRFFVFQYKIIAAPCEVVKNKDKNMSQNNEYLTVLDNLVAEANQAEEVGDLEIALKLYDRALKMDPKHYETLIGIGNTYMKLQQPEKAKNFFEQALSLEPENTKGLLGVGSLALHNGDLNKANICFTKLLRNEPDNTKALCGLGILMSSRNDLGGAMGYFCKALDINPDNISACQLLLELSYKTEKFERIEFYLHKYLEFHPANLNMQFALAGIQYKLEKFDEAIKNLEQILILDPKHELALTLLDDVRADVV